MRSSRPLSVECLIACIVLTGFLIIGFGREAKSQAGTPVDEFATEYKKLKESLGDLPKKIDDTGRTVEQNSNPTSAKTQIDTLRGIISTVLEQVADNGPVSKM